MIGWLDWRAEGGDIGDDIGDDMAEVIGWVVGEGGRYRRENGGGAKALPCRMARYVPLFRAKIPLRCGRVLNFPILRLLLQCLNYTT